MLITVPTREQASSEIYRFPLRSVRRTMHAYHRRHARGRSNVRLALVLVELSSLSTSNQLPSKRSTPSDGVEGWYERTCHANVMGKQRTVRAGRAAVAGTALDVVV